MPSPKRTAERSKALLVGLDLGTTKISLVAAKPGTEGIEIVGIAQIPFSGLRKGAITNIPATVDAIKRVVQSAQQMAGSPITHAAISIAGQHIKGFNSTGVVAIKGNEVTPSDVERAMDAASAVAFPPDRERVHILSQEFIVNDQEGVRDPVGMAGVRLESRVHIVTASLTNLQNLSKCAELSGISLDGFVLDGIATADAVLTPDEKELGVALIDVGGTATHLAIFLRGTVVHTATLQMGSSHVTNDIAVGLRTTIQDAENIKIEHGSTTPDVGDDSIRLQIPLLGGKTRDVAKKDLVTIIEARVEELLNLVAQEIDHSGYRANLSTGVVLTGGGSLLKGFAEFSEYILEIPTRRGVPMGIGGLSEGVSHPSFATAVGMALYAHRSGLRSKERSTNDKNNFGRVFTKVRNWIEEVF